MILITSDCQAPADLFLPGRRNYYLSRQPPTDVSFCGTLSRVNMIVFDNPTEYSISKMLAVVPPSSTVTELRITFHYWLQTTSKTPTEEKFTGILRLPVWNEIRSNILSRLPALSLVSIDFSHRVAEDWTIPQAFKSAIAESFALPTRITLQFQAKYMRSE